MSDTRIDGSIDYPAYCISLELGLLRRFSKRHWRKDAWVVDDKLMEEITAEIHKQIKHLRERALEPRVAKELRNTP